MLNENLKSIYFKSKFKSSTFRDNIDYVKAMCPLYFSNSTNITSYCNNKSIKNKSISLCWQKFEIDFDIFVGLNLFDYQISQKYSQNYYKRLLLERLITIPIDNLIFFELYDSKNNEKIILNIEKTEFCPTPFHEYLNQRKNCTIEEQVSFFNPIISSI